MRTCKNCKTRYTNKFNFCPNCGAKWLEYRLTPRKITAEFAERYLGTENVFIRTCVTLLRYPEDVINGYITGQRKKYVNVINFYFIGLTLFGLHIFILKNFYPELLGLGTITKNGEDISEKLSMLYDYMGIFSTVFLPLYAFSGWLVFIKRKYNFVEHLVLYGYVFGIINIISFIATPVMIMASINYQGLSILTTVITLILTAWYYKRIFKLSFINVFFKSILGIIVFSTLQFIITIIIGVIAFAIIYGFSPESLEAFNININGKKL